MTYNNNNNSVLNSDYV